MITLSHSSSRSVLSGHGKAGPGRQRTRHGCLSSRRQPGIRNCMARAVWLAPLGLSRLRQGRLQIFDAKKESLATDVKYHRRLMRVIDLAPKPAHMHVHEVGLWDELVLPHLSKKHFTRKYLALVTHHILEQAKLSRSQINRAVASLGRAFDEIELKRSHAQFCLRGIDRTPRQGF